MIKGQTIGWCVMAILLAGGCERAPDRPTAVLEEREEPGETVIVEHEALGPAVTYAIAPESDFSFTGYYVGGSQTGGFLIFDGQWVMQGESPETAEAEIFFFTDSVHSTDERLTRTLVGENFFDAMNHPEALFTSSRIQREQDDTYRITGDLQLRGVDKTLSFPARIWLEDEAVRVQAEFQVDRTWWDLGRGGIGDYALRDRVDLAIDLTAQPE